VRTVIRRLTAWVATASIVCGVVLPVFAKPVVADSDGACGPAIVLAHSIQHFENTTPADTDHCVLHHLWNAVANASASAPTELAPPAPALADIGQPQADRFYLSDRSERSPRGPPAIS
jgi:hypothetical protein